MTGLMAALPEERIFGYSGINIALVYYHRRCFDTPVLNMPFVSMRYG